MSNSCALLRSIALVMGLIGTVAGAVEPTGPMTVDREFHTAASLPGGRVLVAGGLVRAGDFLVPTRSAEIYDPASGSFTATGSLASAREEHAAAVLADGRVLVVGGRGEGFNSTLASAEIYDPATGIWTATGSMRRARASPLAITLPDGKVLVIGGAGETSSCELFDPLTGMFGEAPSLFGSSAVQAAALLDDGSVLVVGGPDRFFSQLRDPSTGQWSRTVPMSYARSGPTVSRLPDGRALVAGGEGSSPLPAEILDPATREYSTTGTPRFARNGQLATSLADGSVLVAGGFGEAAEMLERYDPVSGTWSVAGSMTSARRFHTATTLANGKVLIAGGYPHLATADLFDPACASAPASSAISPSTLSVPGYGGTRSVAVTYQPGCRWIATNVPSWVTITSGAPGHGSGNVVISFGSNPQNGQNPFVIRIAEKDLVVYQDMDVCPSVATTISPPSLSIGASGGGRNLAVSRAFGCPWSVTNIPDWITFPAGSSGFGNAMLPVLISPNVGPSRLAQLLIGGTGFPVAQDAGACATPATISPASQAFGAQGGDGSVSVARAPGCPWSVSGVPSWITITSGSSGTGSGSVAYSVAPNTGASRSATLSVAGNAFVVTQAADSCTAATSTVAGVPYPGTLTTTDCDHGARGPGYYTDRYSFEGQPGQRVAINLLSIAFDTYLYLRGPNGAVIASNNDGGPGPNSRIPNGNGYFRLPPGAAGTYVIEVTSQRRHATGAYLLIRSMH